ncbi:GlxA family transcriptional regulator [Amycolatopsis sp. EV170708-02-1]|uniref:GlxA family transcriptional regulator n=1 Tax=Amycolatopsis sp. EV170708-02-1 TaxID=2919322 RepID=UPI001F0C6723|nr:DJ-1/PfpI family protein [Amycolatopsis sp. EV170708-02-1]UMP07537.1 DJ-1/PfpI family protein [Amycolatopsis sp. EV170708-02-1]
MVIVAFDDAQILDVACPSGALEIANSHGAAPPYVVELATLDGRTTRSSSGIMLAGARRLAEVSGRMDTVIVVGGAGTGAAAVDERLLTQVRRLAGRSRRIASVCTGAFVLAAAGLLDDRRVTTHWGYGELLAATFPAVTVDPAPLYIRDGNVFTSAGVISALDLTLALIEDDCGPTLAREVARELVTYLHRPGDQAQISTFLAVPPPGNRVVRDLLGYIAAHLAEDLSPSALAARAGVTTRHLTRLFTAQLGSTPARTVRTARTEAAAQLVRSTALPLAAVARRCGFASPETLRTAFRQYYGITGDTLRRMKDMPHPIGA